jgi:endonuclease/exonuclease/phosphatase family metal-dependent hydrolase
VPELVVASFNIYWGASTRSRTPFDVAAACAELDADVLVLQECWRRDGTPGHAAEVGTALGYAVVESPPMVRSLGFPKPRALPLRHAHLSEGDWYLAVLSRLPVRTHEVTPLPKLRLDVSRRFVLTVEVEVGGDCIPIAATHLAHLEMGVMLQRRALRAALPPADRSAVFAGDMNMWGWCIDLLVPEGWRRAVHGATWPARRPHSQIDHILATSSVRTLSSEVVPLVRSDHLPVRAHLAFD